MSVPITVGALGFGAIFKLTNRGHGPLLQGELFQGSGLSVLHWFSILHEENQWRT